MKSHILIGLGGTGGKILKEFKKRLFQEYTDEERSRLPIGFVYVDSCTEMEMVNPADKSWYACDWKAPFTEDEFVNIGEVKIESILDHLQDYPGLKDVVGDPEIMREALGPINIATNQKRRAGRILFAANIEKYKKALLFQYDRVSKIGGV